REIALIDAPGGSGTDNGDPSGGGSAYCYNVSIIINYPCSGLKSTGTHYHDSACGCKDTPGCSSPFSQYLSDTFCTSDSNSTAAASTYLANNNQSGGGNSNVTTANNNIIISSIIENQVPEGADPLAFKLNLASDSDAYNWLVNTATIDEYNALGFFLEENPFSDEAKAFANLAIDYLIANPNKTFDDVLYSRTSFDVNNAIDIDNNIDGGYDTNTYSDFNPQQMWTAISQVIPTREFVGWGSPGIKRNCMDYAKAQIAKKGYQISNYGSVGQTFQIYTEQNGVNQTNLLKGLNYLKYALNNNIPVVVGIDDNPGHPGNPDNSTDHFVVIVGMGSNSNGNYFQFYDNASGNISEGTSPLNLLYYNSSTGKISGKSQCNGYFSSVAHDYVITQIRKSKTKL
ncbi:C1 family peptidase, partial [Flavobacterium rhamnosiphilum]|uniref:hypothetical protein n=1 Tax=Flavobacterium rhamnosiphilum TaxID=2541724 RepID=UPI00140533E6